MNLVVFYTIGLLLFLSGILYWLIRRKHSKYSKVISMVCFYLSVVVWYIPLEISNVDYTVTEAIISAFFQGIYAFKADSFSKPAIYGTIAPLYQYSILIERIVILLFVFGIIASVAVRPAQYVRFFLKKRRRIFVFPELNQKTINIADSIDDRKNTCIVFYNETGFDKEQINSIKSCEGVFFECSHKALFTHIIKDKQYYTGERTIIYFDFFNEEKENIRCLAELSDVLASDKNRQMKVYAEANDISWQIQNTLSQNLISRSNFIVNFVRVKENFVYNNLLRHNILTNLPEGKVTCKQNIKVLIIGSDIFSAETFKTILWLCQLPCYRPVIRMISNRKFSENLRYQCPELARRICNPGYADYEFEIYEEVDYQSPMSDNLINGFIDFTYCFIDSGDDTLNYNYAWHIRELKARNKMNDNYVIHIRNKDYGAGDLFENNNIMIVGCDAELYSVNNITNSEIEKRAVLIHNERQKKKKEINRQARTTKWDDYCKNEYFRRSTYARALGINYKLEVIKKYYNSDFDLLKDDEMWRSCEHMRWNVYMWSSGYVRSDIKDLYVARTHTDFVNYYQLSNDKQINDAIDIRGIDKDKL